MIKIFCKITTSILFITTSFQTIAFSDTFSMSKKLKCEFNVDKSGEQHTGNFYPCKIEGCAERAYKYYNTPKSYTSIKDFIVNFKENTVSYKIGVFSTYKEIKSSKRPAYYLNNKLINSFIDEIFEAYIIDNNLDVTRKRNSAGKEMVFIYSQNKKVIDFLLDQDYYSYSKKFTVLLDSQRDPKKKYSARTKIIHFLNSENGGHSDKSNIITFYGKNKITWSTESIMNLGRHGIGYSSTTAFGECETIN